MKVVIAIFAALCMVQGLSAMGVKHRRDATGLQPLEELWNNTQTFFQNLATEMQNKLPTSEQAQQQMRTTLDEMAHKMQEISASMTEQGHAVSGALSETLNKAAEHINATIAQVRASHPDAAHQAETLRQNIESMMQTVMTETKKVKDQMSGPTNEMVQTVSTMTENALNEMKRLAEQANQRLQEVAAAH